MANRNLLELLNLKEGELDLLSGGYPCQSFSYAGKRLGLQDVRGTMFYHYATFLHKLQPKMFLFENVKGLLTLDGGRTYKTILDIFEDEGYTTVHKVLNAWNYGVPQKRERIFIVGFLDDVEFEFPSPIPVEERLTLSDILETNVPEKYYVRDKIKESRLERLKDKNYPKPYISHENIAGSITPHPYSSALRAGVMRT